MDENALARLSPEQSAALSAELKAVFCMLSPADQDFFSRTFKPADLPTVLTRKGEILKRSQAERERMEKLRASIAQAEDSAHPPVEDNAGEVLGAVAGAVGIGAAAAVVATGNSAHYQGVAPSDLVAPLRAEFGAGHTAAAFTGRPESLVGTISLLTGSGPVPALTINLDASEGGLDVKVNDLTTQGLIETVKEGGLKLLGAAQAGLDLLARTRMGQFSPGDVAQLLQRGSNLAEVAGELKLKERAWKVIRASAESVEAGFLSRQEEERKARALLEKAWDNHYSCPTCGVAFGDADKECRVCGTARPEPPVRPDPRKS